MLTWWRVYYGRPYSTVDLLLVFLTYLLSIPVFCVSLFSQELPTYYRFTCTSILVKVEFFTRNKKKEDWIFVIEKQNTSNNLFTVLLFYLYILLFN